MSCCCCVQVRQSSAGILETVGGQFDDVIPPGCNYFNPCSQKFAGTQSLRTQILHCEAQAVTRDSAQIFIRIAIIYKAIAAQVHRAFYSMSSTQQQIVSLVIANVRGMIPEKSLDSVFLERQQIASALRGTVGVTLQGYGFDLIDVLIEDISPRGQVRDAMNNQVFQRYNRVVQELQGEIGKIKQLKEAEAHAEASRLRGEGTARERSAIAQGFEDGMSGRDPTGTMSQSELLAVMLMTQYFDMVNDIAKCGKVKPVTYYMPMNQHGSVDRGELSRRLKLTLSTPSTSTVTQRGNAAARAPVDDGDL